MKWAATKTDELDAMVQGAEPVFRKLAKSRAAWKSRQMLGYDIFSCKINWL